MCCCCNATSNRQTQIAFNCKSFEYLGITSSTGKFAKTLQRFAIFDQMVLDGYKASFHNFKSKYF